MSKQVNHLSVVQITVAVSCIQHAGFIKKLCPSKLLVLLHTDGHCFLSQYEPFVGLGDREAMCL